MHIYMSVGAFNEDAGAFLDGAGNPTHLANYRGESGPGDDVGSFTARMEKKGHAVIAISAPAQPGEILTTESGFSFKAHYNAAFAKLGQQLRGG